MAIRERIGTFSYLITYLKVLVQRENRFVEFLLQPGQDPVDAIDRR